MEPQLLTIDQAAKAIGVTDETFRVFVSNGEVAVINISAGQERPRWRVTPAAIEAFLASRTTKPRSKRGDRRGRADR